MEPKDLLENIANKADKAPLFSSASTSIFTPGNSRPKSGKVWSTVNDAASMSASLHQRYQISRPNTGVARSRGTASISNDNVFRITHAGEALAVVEKFFKADES